MSHYVRNKLAGSLGLRQGRIRLSPAGQRGDTKKARAGYETHPELLDMVKKGWVEVLTYAEYSASKTKKPAKVTPPPPPEKKEEKPAPPADPPAATEPEPEPEVEPVAEEPSNDVKSLEEFGALTRKGMSAYIAELGLEDGVDQRSKAKMVKFYEEWLAERS
jgi:hypothetical protein